MQKLKCQKLFYVKARFSSIINTQLAAAPEVSGAEVHLCVIDGAEGGLQGVKPREQRPSLGKVLGGRGDPWGSHPDKNTVPTERCLEVA